jgi:hypothetical protein
MCYICSACCPLSAEYSSVRRLKLVVSTLCGHAVVTQCESRCLFNGDDVCCNELTNPVACSTVLMSGRLKHISYSKFIGYYLTGVNYDVY